MKKGAGTGLFVRARIVDANEMNIRRWSKFHHAVTSCLNRAVSQSAKQAGSEVTVWEQEIFEEDGIYWCLGNEGNYVEVTPCSRCAFSGISALLAQRGEWMDKGACWASENPAFIPNRHEVESVVAPARVICEWCVVKSECGEWALEYERLEPNHLVGVWGGLTHAERKAIVKAE